MIINNALLLNDSFEFVKSDLRIEDGIFKEIGTIKEQGIDICGKYLIPGLIDIHNHGCKGFDPTDNFTYEALNEITKYRALNGTTTLLMTLSVAGKDTLLESSKSIKKAVERGITGADIAGIYMEGPYLSYERCGAQNSIFLRKPDSEEISEIQAASGNMIKVVSVAPELEGAIQFIEENKEKFKIFMGHTAADISVGIAAIKAGITGVTHTFNAMNPINHRNPGAITAALNSNIFCELICDGFHIHPEIIKLMFRVCGSDRVILISDSVAPMGMSDGTYDIEGREVVVKDGKAKLTNGVIFGGTTELFDCMKNAVSYGIPLSDAVKCASKNPAVAVGIYDSYGSITIGKKANFLVVDKSLNLCAVYLNGELYSGGLI